MYLGGSHPIFRLDVKRIVLFAIRIGFLPRWAWFHDLIKRELWRPAEPRDAGMVSGWIEIGQDVSWQSANRFRDWWYLTEKSSETAGDDPE